MFRLVSRSALCRKLDHMCWKIPSLKFTKLSRPPLIHKVINDKLLKTNEEHHILFMGHNLPAVN